MEEGRTRVCSFPSPLRDQEMTMSCRVGKSEKNAHFLCIHKKEPVDFHSLNILPWKNHRDVPWWWILDAWLWLVDGSGGESHHRRLSRVWFPVKMIEASEWRVVSWVKDARLAWSNLLSTPCTLSSTARILSLMLSTLLSIPSTFFPTSCTSPLTCCTALSTPITFPSMQWVVFSSSADASHASSCVNLSSLCRLSSRFVFPINFFKYFSE